MNSKSIASGLFWKFAERVCAQGVSFIVSIILARMLSPSDYGVIAMILVFINLANTFVSAGFSSALIQKKDADEIDYSTMFYCSLAIAIIMYFTLFASAPFIEKFYGEDGLAILLRVLGIKLIINSYNSIQHARISSDMQFKKFFFSTIIGTLISAVVGIYMAFHGAGAWALVAQYLINSLIDTIVLNITVDWKPRLVFSLARAKGLMEFGWKVTMAEFLGTAYNEMRSLVIGKFFSASDLAYYNKAEQFPKLFANNILTTVTSVLFPALSNVSDSKTRIREMTRSSIKATCFVMFPLMLGMGVVAEPLIKVVLTEKWIAAVPYLQIACFSYAILPLNNTNVQAIKAMGEGTVYLRIEVIKKVMGIVIIFASAQISVYAVAISAVLIAFIYLIINIAPNGRLLGYGFFEQIKDIAPYILYSGLMCLAVFAVGRILTCSDIISLFIQVIVGIAVYFGLAIITKNEELIFFVELLKKYVKKSR